MAKNSNLHSAKTAKNDEFYTQYEDIEAEMNAYIEYDKDVFRGKTVLCPCDDPEWSNFTKYFVANFERLGLKKFISTSYAPNSGLQKVSLWEEESEQYDAEKHEKCGRLFILEEDTNGSGRIDKDDLKWSYLSGNGDFRSEEVTALRDEADFIITNPPFSLFREFIAWVMAGNKKFAVIGNMNAVQDKNIFPLIRDVIVWTGANYPKKFTDPNGDFNDFGNIMWYTNIDHGIRHEHLQLMTIEDNFRFNKKLIKKLSADGVLNYNHYENYDAIEVPFVDAIPSNYDGVMGVPISFLNKYNPDQFQILSLGTGIIAKEFGISPIPKDIDESLPGHSSVWRLYFIKDGEPVCPFGRILIKKKGR